MTREEILKMVDKHKAIEQSKLYNKSHIWTMNPPFNYAVKDTMAFAPFYPEMNEVGYNHKVHGNNVVPDYRVYQRLHRKTRKGRPQGSVAQKRTLENVSLQRLPIQLGQL